MFYIVANMVWLKVVNNNIDEYLDKDNVSRELISYEGKKKKFGILYYNM